MWHLDAELADHFEWVKEERERKNERSDDKQEAQPMNQNEMAKGRGRDAG